MECKNESDNSNNRGTGTMSKSFTKYLRNMHGKQKIKELQRSAILGTAHKIQKVLMEKNRAFNM